MVLNLAIGLCLALAPQSGGAKLSSLKQRLLRSDSADVRLAQDELVKLGSAAVPLLVIIMSRKPKYWGNATHPLMEIGRPSVMPLWVVVSGEPGRPTTSTGLLVLARVRGKDAVSELISLIVPSTSSPQESVRLKAYALAAFLNKWGRLDGAQRRAIGEAMVRSLSRAVGEESSDLAVWMENFPEAVDGLGKLLMSGAKPDAAAKALAKNATPDGCKWLEQGTRHKNPKVREWSAHGLVHGGCFGARSTLIKLKHDPSPAVRRRIMALLKKTLH